MLHIYILIVTYMKYNKLLQIILKNCQNYLGREYKESTKLNNPLGLKVTKTLWVLFVIWPPT